MPTWEGMKSFCLDQRSVELIGLLFVPSSSDAFGLMSFKGLVSWWDSGLSLDAVVLLPLLSLTFDQATEEAVCIMTACCLGHFCTLSISAPQKFQLSFSRGMKAHQPMPLLLSAAMSFTCCSVQLLSFSMSRQLPQESSGVIWKLNTQRSALIRFILYKFNNHLF